MAAGMSGAGLTFGIYPGSALGGVELGGPPDRPDRINTALDLVAQYHSRSGDVAGFCAFVEDLAGRHGEHLATLQVCEEPNVTGDPALDGAYPRVAEALVAGVKTAKQATERSGRDIKVGCNSTPCPARPLASSPNLTRAGGERFVADLDYIGLDFFPDVFRPVAWRTPCATPVRTAPGCSAGSG